MRSEATLLNPNSKRFESGARTFYKIRNRTADITCGKVSVSLQARGYQLVSVPKWESMSLVQRLKIQGHAQSALLLRRDDTRLKQLLWRVESRPAGVDVATGASVLGRDGLVLFLIAS